MTTPHRDLQRLAQRVKAHRLELYPSRLAAAQAAGVSKDTWQKVEEGQKVRESSYGKIARSLGWTTHSCVAIAEGGEPVLADANGRSPSGAPAAKPLSPEAVRRAAFEAARAKLPNMPIGDIDAFSDELVENLRRAGSVADGA
ncbi:helix-turn-helix domain-containing protein [Streptomyces sp. TRM72054]|uniref:helix-turn-helix domain-containing protein n=1 Tax=Streptomyces sp. TRM72054 TaxID=2870562 RepID=UPI001C8B0E33|nr:helix-turn-helix transcriptional regulator [Streptomyces sp. TRM72054]MBX9392209.1 helix-turn-helix domain-containing protein [Streptomyces sp. TRM72054]